MNYHEKEQWTEKILVQQGQHTFALFQQTKKLNNFQN